MTAAMGDYPASLEWWRSLFADSHRADLEDAYRRGRQDEAAEMAAAWRRDGAEILAILIPDGKEAREAADRRIRAAEAGCRRDAADHEQAFVARAYNTADRDRTDVQRGTVRLYPPVQARRSA